MCSRTRSARWRERTRGGCRPSSPAQDSSGRLRRHIAAGDENDRALGLDPAAQPRRRGDRGGGLARELGALVQVPEGVPDLVLADEVVLEIAADLERQATGD